MFDKVKLFGRMKFVYQDEICLSCFHFFNSLKVVKQTKYFLNQSIQIHFKIRSRLAHDYRFDAYYLFVLFYHVYCAFILIIMFENSSIVLSFSIHLILLHLILTAYSFIFLDLTVES